MNRASFSAPFVASSMVGEKDISGRTKITDDEFGARFTMLDPVTRSSVTTRRGKDEDGADVMIHFVGDDDHLPGSSPFDPQLLDADLRAAIRQVFDVDGYLVVVTDILEEFTSFEAWMAPTEETSQEETARGVYTSTFDESRPSSPEATDPPPEPSPPQPPDPSPPPPESAPGSEPGVYTRVMREQTPEDPPSPPPSAPDHAVPPRRESRPPPPPSGSGPSDPPAEGDEESDPPPARSSPDDDTGAGVYTRIMRAGDGGDDPAPDPNRYRSTLDGQGRRNPSTEDAPLQDPADQDQEPGPYTRFMRGPDDASANPPPPPPPPDALDSGAGGAGGRPPSWEADEEDDYLGRLRAEGEDPDGPTAQSPSPPPSQSLDPTPPTGPSEYTVFVKGGAVSDDPLPGPRSPTPPPPTPATDIDRSTSQDPRPPGPSKTPIIIGLVLLATLAAAIVIILAVRAG